MKSKSLITIASIVCTLFLPVLMYAQGNPGQDPDTGVPFDGGISLLIGAGVAYGFKKAYDKRKKNRQEENTKL